MIVDYNHRWGGWVSYALAGVQTNPIPVGGFRTTLPQEWRADYVVRFSNLYFLLASSWGT